MENLHKLLDMMITQTPITFTKEGLKHFMALSGFKGSSRIVINSIGIDSDICVFIDSIDECIYDVRPEWILI